MYEKCGLRVKAAEEALKVKDMAALERLRSASQGTGEQREIERLLGNLKK